MFHQHKETTGVRRLVTLHKSTQEKSVIEVRIDREIQFPLKTSEDILDTTMLLGHKKNKKFNTNSKVPLSNAVDQEVEFR